MYTAESGVGCTLPMALPASPSGHGPLSPPRSPHRPRSPPGSPGGGQAQPSAAPAAGFNLTSTALVPRGTNIWTLEGRLEGRWGVSSFPVGRQPQLGLPAAARYCARCQPLPGLLLGPGGGLLPRKRGKARGEASGQPQGRGARGGSWSRTPCSPLAPPLEATPTSCPVLCQQVRMTIVRSGSGGSGSPLLLVSSFPPDARVMELLRPLGQVGRHGAAGAHLGQSCLLCRPAWHLSGPASHPS